MPNISKKAKYLPKEIYYKIFHYDPTYHYFKWKIIIQHLNSLFSKKKCNREIILSRRYESGISITKRRCFFNCIHKIIDDFVYLKINNKDWMIQIDI